MAEEFQESDIIFSDHDNDGSKHNDDEDHYFDNKENMQKDLSCKNMMSSHNNKDKKTAGSIPVNIPGIGFRFVDSDEEFVPPHVIVAKRVAAGEMACCGNGVRRLKGRDLSYVRNSVLRMTGFLET